MGKFIDLTGQTFGRLFVVERAPNIVGHDGKSRVAWRCHCQCGHIVNVAADALRSGRQVSCGCYRRDKLSDMSSKHNMTNTKLYGVWSSMKSRCYNQNVYEYRFYGALGVTICDQWLNDFKSFADWALQNGYDENAPRGVCTIDRIDGTGSYCPENCRIVNQLTQANNLKSNHYLSYNGERHSIAEWSRITGINQFKIRNRIVKLGWTTERALTTK